MTSHRGRSARGLVADDDPLIRMVLRLALEGHGVEVDEATSEIPVLVISGAPPNEGLPADVEHLMKPIELSDFVRAVDRMLTRATRLAGRAAS